VPLRVATTTLAFTPPPSTEALLAAAGENNFDFRIRRAELEQQGYQVRLALHERNPAISVSPFYSQEKAGERESTLGVGVSLPLPITNRSRGAMADLAEARRRQAEASVFVAQREIERDVLLAAQTFNTKVGEIKRWSADAAEKFREAASLADRHYRLGAVPIATYVELQNSYLDAVEALLDTQSEALEAGLKLQQLTGLEFNAVKSTP
jgi:cobalt-zinc-cadmium efflux system outer membrane protein